MSNIKMYVHKRNGDKEEVSFDKIMKRLRILSNLQFDNYPKLENVNITDITMKVIQQMYDGIYTHEIDELSAQQCASLTTQHHDYAELAKRIVISNHQKDTEENRSFKQVMTLLYENIDIHGYHTPIVSKDVYEIANEFDDVIEKEIDYDRDFFIDYFGFKTLERAYLMRKNKKILERPQHLWMRVAIGIHGKDLGRAFHTYHLLSKKYFIHATPTLFNAGTLRPQLSSCYLIAMQEDSINGIYDTLKDCALISKWAGGVGLHIHNVRGTGTHIRGTNGTSNGIVPMLRVFNNTARYVDQCVVPETTIYTNNGPIAIQDCEQDVTSIITTNGMEPIQNVLEHSYDGDMLEVYTLHSFEPLKITPEHPVLCLQNQPKGLNYEIIKRRLERNFIKPEWVEAKHLTTEDFVIMTIPTYEQDSKLTNDDCYMYGLLLGYGSMNNTSTTTHISLHTENKKDNLEFIKSYLDNNYTEYYITTEGNTTRIIWNKNIQLPFRYASLYNSNKCKYINSKWLHLPLKKVKHIVKGLIESCGTKNKEIVFDNTSKVLVEGLRYLLLRLGIPSSGYVRDRVGEKHIIRYNEVTENKKISYSIRISKKSYYSLFNGEYNNDLSNTFSKYFSYNNMIFTRVQNIKQSKYNGTLYDLQIKHTHNYLVHNASIHNGGGKRNGSFAIYLEPWHADIEDFVEMKKNHGDEEMKARDLFYALWIPDLFMNRVKEDGFWTLMCPDKCPGLSNVYGKEFEMLYNDYERKKMGTKTIRARKLWFSILDSQIETGTPYMLYKDACNTKSNHKHLGTIKSSNLCTEIIEFSDKNETAVCNLGSIGLPSFVKIHKYPGTKVTIYTKTNCPYCKLAKDYLEKMNMKIHIINLDDDNERAEIYTKLSERLNTEIKTVPQIFIEDDNYIGGYEDLIKQFRPEFNFIELENVVKTLTYNLNKIIDINFYPTEKTKLSNKRHRPIGIGVQGLADVFSKMFMSFDCDDAQILNKQIFETIYHASLEESIRIAKQRREDITPILEIFSKHPTTKGWYFLNGEIIVGQDTEFSNLLNIHTNQELINYINEYHIIIEECEAYLNNPKWCGAYSSFNGSPLSKGLLQFDFWDIKNVRENAMYDDWDVLRGELINSGCRNSLLLAPMPTASTSQILGNNECFEPYTSNIYSRRTIAGEFVIVNRYLMNDLLTLGLWDDEMKNEIIYYKGSINNIERIPKCIRERYKTVWDMSMKTLIDMSRDRGAYICQSQSLNMFMEDANYEKLTKMHFYAWKQGLKTGMYYLRTRPKWSAQQFTIDPKLQKKFENRQNVKTNITNNNYDICESCSG